MKFSYSYYKNGTSKEHDNPADLELWFDIGNRIGKTVIDHHGDKRYCSTVQAMCCEYAELEDVLNVAAEAGELTLGLHSDPDLDCIASVFLAEAYFEQDGSYSERWEKVKEKYAKLIRYVDEIDQGKKKKVSGPLNLFIAFAVMKVVINGEVEDAAFSEADERNGKIVEQGLALLEQVYDCPEEINSEIDVRIRKTIDEDLRTYEDERRKRIFELKNIGTGNGASIKAGIWHEPSKTIFGYQRAREEGAVLTFCPQPTGKEGESRVMISLNPDIPDVAAKYPLLELAKMIERQEQILDHHEWKQTGYYRRDYSSARRGLHQQVKPFSQNSDPWYINPAMDMMDAPKANSKQEIKELLYFAEHAEELKIIEEKYAQDGKQDAYQVIFLDVSPALLKHNDDLLKYICMEKAGESYSDQAENRVLVYNYRIVIYFGENAAVIGYAGEFRNSDLTVNAPTLSPEEKAKLKDCIFSIAAEKQELLQIAAEVKQVRDEGKRKQSKKVGEIAGGLSKRLADLKIDRKELGGNPLLARVTAFAEQQMDLNELEDDLYHSVQLLDEKLSEEKNRRLNFMFGVITVLTLFSVMADGITVVQFIKEFISAHF